LDSLVRYAPVILFSAAIPHQGGIDHVNEQWPDYWVERFDRREYLPVDCIRPALWRNESVSFAYRQNMLLFVRRDVLARNETLRRAHELTRLDQLSIVHPQALLACLSDRDNIGFQQAVAAVPAALMRAIRRRM
jgi:hypothetical protein